MTQKGNMIKRHQIRLSPFGLLFAHVTCPPPYPFSTIRLLYYPPCKSGSRVPNLIPGRGVHHSSHHGG